MFFSIYNGDEPGPVITLDAVSEQAPLNGIPVPVVTAEAFIDFANAMADAYPTSTWAKMTADVIGEGNHGTLNVWLGEDDGESISADWAFNPVGTTPDGENLYALAGLVWQRIENPDAAKYDDGTGDYELDTYIQDGPVRVAFTDLGEGRNGDYDEDDPEDVRLLRLDVHVTTISGYGGEDTGEADWQYPSGGSICTQVPVDTDSATLRRLLRWSAANLRATVESNESVRHTMGTLSWMDAATITPGTD